MIAEIVEIMIETREKKSSNRADTAACNLIDKHALKLGIDLDPCETCELKIFQKLNRMTWLAKYTKCN